MWNLVMKALVRALLGEVKPLGKRVGVDGRGAHIRTAVSTSMMNARWSEGYPDNSSSIVVPIQRRRNGEHIKNSFGERVEREKEGMFA
mmetsp:Transcript_26674/g.41409  ORF Transcript_26674/g.41409 Transcript_26674/m.41409 type:complete len:88 (-) Transcript_26674:248-511(-)